MKTIRFYHLLATIVVSGFLFSSCQKEISGTDPVPDNTVKLSLQGANSVSAAIGVWHSQRITGTVPANNKSTDLKIIGPEGGNIQAIAGNYGFIQPTIESGDVAGYYVQVEGAADYFKVDYTKPRKSSSANGTRSTISTAGITSPGHKTETPKPRSPFSVMGGADNNNDSAIVITLPPDIKAPDTICVKYWAYDEAGWVSNPVTTCIYINHLGGDENGKWLAGTWRKTAELEYIDGQKAEDCQYIYNKWVRTSGNWLTYRREDSLISSSPGALMNGQPYYTYYNVAEDMSYSIASFVLKSTDVLLGGDSVFYKKTDITFNVSSIRLLI